MHVMPTACATDETILPPFDAPLWRWNGANQGNWFFVTIDGTLADSIAAHAFVRRLETGRRRGFGSVKVRATIGDATWQTSVFPDKRGWILPIKAAVRRSQSLNEGMAARIKLTLL